jgi:hypothetical protein
MADMADEVLGAREHWAFRAVERDIELQTSYNEAKNTQERLQENPEIISEWFKLVEDTKIKYGVHDNDVHNFDEIAIQMNRPESPDLIQRRDREFVTVIQSICAAGYATPPFIIYKDRVHLSAWYEEANIPCNWKFSVSKSGLTSNALGLEWFKHFDAYTKARQVKEYRLLILDGHESFLNQDFKDYCLEHKILTLCMPPRSSHFLQPLDLDCFLRFNRNYDFRDSARWGIQIDKERFLPVFKNAYFDVFTEENCREAFQATGLVPTNAQVVLDRLEEQLHTPVKPYTHDNLWQPKAPSNTHEFKLLSERVRKYLTLSPISLTAISVQADFAQLEKGAELMVHQNELLAAKNKELQEQSAVMTKRKSHKRKHIQERGQPALRRCGKCRGTDHDARTCKKDTDIF